MFPGINKKEQDRVRARFSMDVTKRCSAEIKQAHTQFAGHAESPSEVNCPTTRGVSSWAILCAHLSAERLSFPITSVRSKFAVQIPHFQWM
jgi:hypothetical protein